MNKFPLTFVCSTGPGSLLFININVDDDDGDDGDNDGDDDGDDKIR